MRTYPGARRGWSPRSRWLSQRSVRTRLTLLYGGLFLVTGALLLAVTYLLVARSPWFGSPSAPDPPKLSLPGPQMGEPTPPDPNLDAPSLGWWLQTQLEDRRDDTLRQVVLGSLVALGMMGGVSLALGWLVAGRMLRPLASMTATVRHISADSLHERLDAAGPDDELKELADTFDQLLQRLDTAFASQRQFVANASHELRTPLTLQRAAVEVALANPDADIDALRSACRKVLDASQEQERLIDALLVLARSQRGLEERRDFDLAVVTRDVLQERAANATAGQIRFVRSLSPAPVSGDPQLVERLVGNLVDNAIAHNVPDGWVEVSAQPSAAGATLTVANSGPAIPHDRVSSLFEPFRRGEVEGDRTRHDGVGLGLSIVAAIVAAHDGSIDAQAQPQGGLLVEVTLPASPRSR